MHNEIIRDQLHFLELFQEVETSSLDKYQTAKRDPELERLFEDDWAKMIEMTTNRYGIALSSVSTVTNKQDDAPSKKDVEAKKTKEDKRGQYATSKQSKFKQIKSNTAR